MIKENSERMGAVQEKRHYDVDGISIDIPVHFDDKAGKYIEDYPNFVEDPIWTGEGCPLMFAAEDACEFAEEATPGGCPDCGSCKHYKPAGEHTWFGVCHHVKKRREEGIRNNE